MSKITNEDLVLLYYGEHDDPGLASKVAESDELSARYDALCEQLGQFDRFTPPRRHEEYGAETWMKISPKLALARETPAGFMQSLRNTLARPRFSFAGATAVAVVAVLAFLLGRQDMQTGGTLPVENGLPQAAAIQLDSARLLASSVSGHLEQMNVMLTEFVNSNESSAFGAERATDMLVANRLYRQAAAARGDHKLANFLAGLEPLLIELAYEAHQGSPLTRDRMQQEAKDSLLFRVRAVNRHLQKSTVST